MAKKILVPLTGLGQVDEIVSHLSDIMKPRTGVVFLIRYPLEPGPYWRAHWVEADTARGAKFASKDLMELTSWEAHRVLAEERLSAARKALENHGIEVEVELYSGSPKRALRNHKASGDFDWIVSAAHFGHWVAYLLAEATGPFDGLKRVKSYFFWLLRPKWI